jgi:hypothetical protein
VSNVPTAPTSVKIKGKVLRDGLQAETIEVLIVTAWPIRGPVDREPPVRAMKAGIRRQVTVAP